METDQVLEIATVAIAVVGEALQLLVDSSEDEDEREIIEKNENFFEITIPNFSDEQFRRNFRIKPDTFEILYVLLSQIHQRHQTEGSQLGQPPIPLEKKLLICLWYMANVESHRGVSDRFGVSKWTCWSSCNLIFSLLSKLNRQSGIISFPSGRRALQIINEFETINGFPGILGAIDGCHIRIEKPKDHGNSYINRKGFPSVLLQGICDRQKRFLHVYAGEPGSIHDYRLYTKSDIYRKILSNQIDFPNNSHLIGDLAYKLSKSLMVGYKDNGQLTDPQKLFNKMLSENRIVIENAFGLLKCRWRRLKMLETKRMDLIPQIIYSCCILHNFAIDQNDIINVENQAEGDSEEVLEEENNDEQAGLKRDNLKNLFYMRSLE